MEWGPVISSDHTVQLLLPTGEAAVVRSSQRPRKSVCVCVCVWVCVCVCLEKQRILKRPKVSVLEEMGIVRAG